MKNKYTKVQSLFGIQIYRSPKGRVTLIDGSNKIYEIVTKNNELLTEKQFTDIIEEKLGFFDVMDRYHLILKGVEASDE